MTSMLKKIIRKLLKFINADLEQRVVDTLHFKQLGRKAPDFLWHRMPCAREAKLDCGGAQVGNKMFVFGGFVTGGDVIDGVDIFDLEKHVWLPRIKTPVGMAQSHLGVVSDKVRYIYIIAGQYGKNCSPPTVNNFVFDTQTKGWLSLPPLPKARYAPTVQLWRGRLHVIGGSKEDRNEPSVDHWSIAVEHGKALEEEWREEITIPRGGPHRASAVFNDSLYVFGGQEGDYVAIPGDPQFTCTGDLTCETVFADVYKLDHRAKNWKRMADMPVASSHTECSTVIVENKIILLGGQHYKNPQTKKIDLTDVIQMYDAKTETWSIIGHLPYPTKSPVVGIYQDHIYFTTGQRNWEGSTKPGPYDNRTWRAKLNGNF